MASAPLFALAFAMSGMDTSRHNCTHQEERGGHSLRRAKQPHMLAAHLQEDGHQRRAE